MSGVLVRAHSRVAQPLQCNLIQGLDEQRWDIQLYYMECKRPCGEVACRQGVWRGTERGSCCWRGPKKRSEFAV